MPTKPIPLRGRFDTKYVVTVSGCWEWTASLTHLGYGQIRTGLASNGRRTMTKAHRVAWELHRGQIPDNFCVLHKCDNRRCVNPDHLFLGTKADNTADMLSKGRECHGERHPNTTLTDADIAQIKALEDSMLQREIAERFGVKQSAISRILRGKRRRECLENGIVLTQPDPELADYQRRNRQPATRAA